MKNFLTVIIVASVVFIVARFEHARGFKEGFAEGWQSYIDNKPPNPPPTKCRWRTDDLKKCKVWKDRT